MSVAVSGGLNIHNGHRLAQCRQPSLEVSTSTMVPSFPKVGSRQWRSQHPQWSQACPKSAAVTGGLNIHNGHRLSQCRQPSVEVSTSTMVTGFPNVGSRQWRSQHPQWSQAFPLSAAVNEVSTSTIAIGFPNVGSRQWRSQHPQWSQACPKSAAVSGGLNINNGHRLSQYRQPSVEVSTSTMVTGFPNIGSRQ